jgi:prepilin-type N-terminal cleavage/methylation domain-containing protein
MADRLMAMKKLIMGRFGNRFYMKTTQKAFTLVELLVVISIIAMLLAVLLPSLNKARENARTIICASNLKNYGVALQAYVNSNDDKTPFVFYWLYSKATLDKPVGKGTGCDKACRWHYDKDAPDGTLWPYLKDKNVNMCATYRNYAMAGGPKLCKNNAKHYTGIAYNPNYSYAMNFWVGWNWKTFCSLPSTPVGEADKIMREQQISMKLSNIKRTGECFAFAEENMWAINMSKGDKWNYSSAYLNDNALWTAAQPGSYTDNLATYHKVATSKRNEGFSNAVFIDGHTATKKGKPEQEAYLDYGIPYKGHNTEIRNIW